MRVFNELKNLYREKEQNNLVIFVGAGISENYADIKGSAGFPSWQTLVDALVAKDMIDKSDMDFLKIAQIFQDNNSKEALVYKVKELFPKEYDFHDIHKLIFDLEPEHILTTNYDSLLEKAMRYKNLDAKYHVADTDEAIPLSKSKQNLLVKAHGDLARGNIVLSEQDYNEYEKNFPLILSFIRYVFSKYKVLFIGFSLSDPNFNKILYWVKNILDEDSIKHSVILHSNITESERVHFEKKSVNVITKEEIVNAILTDNEDENTYLMHALGFIKNGFPAQNYSSLQRLDTFKTNLRNLKYFKYLTPQIAKVFLDNTRLLLHNYESSQSIESNDKKTKRFPWIANIIQEDSRIGQSNQLNLLDLLHDQNEDIEYNEEFKKKYFKEIAKLILSENIASIGYMHSTSNQKPILQLLDDEIINKYHLDYLLTYKYDILENQERFEWYDKSFEESSPYYNLLTFSDNDFYTAYILGNSALAYKQCADMGSKDNFEKYLQYFKLHYLWSQRKITKWQEIDKDSYDMYKTIYGTLDKHSQKILQSLHDLGFVQHFLNNILVLEKNYSEELLSNTVTFGGWDTKTLYRISFYLNYSRFLKFIIFNKFPVIKEEMVVRAISLANTVYFKYFFTIEDDEIELSNWILLGIALDKNFEDVRKVAFDFCKRFSKSDVNIVFDQGYVRDLYLRNMDQKKSDKSIINLKSLFYILALSSKKKTDYIFVLDLFSELINHDLKNIEYFGEAFHMAYKNYTDLNKIDKDIKNKLKLILETYVKYKINYEKNKDLKIDDTKFSHFIFSLENLKFKKKSDEILKLLSSDIDDASCQNLSSLIYLFKIMGYEYDDIKQSIVKPIKKAFDKKDFTTRLQNPSDKCPNQIENSIIRIYKEFNKDLGVKKIGKYYAKELFSSLSVEGYSTKIDDAFEWLIFLINQKAIGDKLYQKIQKNININRDKFISQLKSMYLKDNNNPFRVFSGSRSRNMMVHFLVKYGKVDIVILAFSQIEMDQNINSFVDMIVYLIEDMSIVKHNKKDLMKILNLLKATSQKSTFLSVKLLLENHKKIKNKDLQSLMLSILKNTGKNKI